MGILDTFKKKSAEEKPVAKTAAKAEGKPVVKAEPKKAAKAPAKTAKPQATEGKELTRSGILLQPAFTEKSFRLQELNKYVFYVATDANKNQVRQAIKEAYGTEPAAVHMIKRHAQNIYRWGKEVGKRKAYKKAVVTMPKGTTLPLTTK